jgi:3-phosphoinositide dependent protein kinase-1
VVRLYSTFQSDTKLYFEIELCCDGDLHGYLKNSCNIIDINAIDGRMNYEAVKFYTAEILLILEYIHSQGIAHRDLKAENLLMTKNRHLKLIDFATALVFNDSKIPPQRAEKIRAIREKYGRNIEEETEE